MAPKSTIPSLGDLELMVLLAVLQCGEDSHAPRIRDELRLRGGRQCSRGALYVTLDRLEEKGFLSSHFGAPTASRGGRAKRLFRITPRGVTTLKHSLGALERMRKGLKTLGSLRGG